MLGVRGDLAVATDPPLGCSSFVTDAFITSPCGFPSDVKMFAGLRLRSGSARARHHAILKFGFVFSLFFLVIFFFGVGSDVILVVNCELWAPFAKLVNGSSFEA